MIIVYWKKGTIYFCYQHYVIKIDLMPIYPGVHRDYDDDDNDDEQQQGQTIVYNTDDDDD